MADTSPQKEEGEEAKEEHLFDEAAINSNIVNETSLKEETIVDTAEEHVPQPLEAESTPSVTHHSHEGSSINDKHDDEISSPSSSKENLTTESVVPPDPAEDESLSNTHGVNPQKSRGSGNSSRASNHPDLIQQERDPNDIEPEMKKVIVQGYTKGGTKQATAESKKVPQPPASKSAARPSLTDPKKSFHYQRPAQTKPTPKDVKQGTVNNGVAAAKRPITSTPLRTVGATSTVTAKPTAASINAAAKRLSTPLRPTTTTERKPFTPSATAKRTPSSNPRPTPKAPSTAPPRAMSATRPAFGKTENSALSTPTRNKKYENIQGKVNASSNYTPGGGNVKIFHEKPKFNATSKIGSLQNANHTPGGGRVKIESRKLNFKENAQPKIDAKADIQSPHVEKKILTQKLDWKASPKVGSLANASHKPAGGDVKIFHQKVKVDAAQSKIGSLENANHKPAGGNVNIKEYKVPGNSSSNSVASHSTGTSRRSSTTRNRMPGCIDPITPEEALGRN